MNYEKIQKEILNFLKDYLAKSGAKGFVLGLSGGLDSALVATLCAKISPTHALLMPTNFSNKRHLKDALNLANFLGLNYQIINISNILNTFCSAANLSQKDKLAYGNLAARTRMILLYDYSAKHDFLVVGTSNKSERMLGYGTIYGDMACALNPIGELYKSEIFEFAKFLGVDEGIINKAPSADLWENQSDESDLGYTYSELDAVLKALCAGKSEKILKEKFNTDLVNFIKKKISKNAFKLKMPELAEIEREDEYSVF